MITFEWPPALRDYLTNYQRIVHDQHATAEDCSSAPCGHCALCGNYGKHHSMVEKEVYLCAPTGRIKLTQRLSCANYGIYVATCLQSKQVATDPSDCYHTQWRFLKELLTNVYVASSHWAPTNVDSWRVVAPSIQFMQLGYYSKNIVRKGSHCTMPSWILRKLLTVYHTS